MDEIQEIKELKEQYVELRKAVTSRMATDTQLQTIIFNFARSGKVNTNGVFTNKIGNCECTDQSIDGFYITIVTLLGVPTPGDETLVYRYCRNIEVFHDGPWVDFLINEWKSKETKKELDKLKTLVSNFTPLKLKS